MMEVEGNITTYLQGFIEALKSNKKTMKIAQKLQKIQEAENSCLGWMVRSGWMFRSLFYVV